MKNKYALGIASIAMIAILGIGFALASPFGFGNGLMNSDMSDEEKIEMQEHMESIRTAIENEDFDTWKSLMEAQLTKENFNRLIESNEEMSKRRILHEELQQAIEDGDTEKAEELRTELHDLMPEQGFGERQHSQNFRMSPQ